MAMNKNGTPKAEVFYDNSAIIDLYKLVCNYDTLIPVLENDQNDDVKDMGFDLRDNLYNLQKIRNKIEVVLLAGTLDETIKSPQIINMYIQKMDKIFNKYNSK